jgi:WD40 repeat protein
VTRLGPMIRIVRNNRMEFAATILEEPSLGKYPIAAFSPCGTFFAACSYPATRGSKRELALFDLRTMAKTQSVVFSDGNNFGGIAMSPDGKTLAATYRNGGTRLIECHDLTIRKYVDTEQRSDDEPMGIWPVVFDPTSRFFAAVRSDGRVDLRSI